MPAGRAVMTKVTWALLGVVCVILFVAAWKWSPGLTMLLVFVALIAGGLAWLRRQTLLDATKNEALFVSMFPDLQPFFHPAKLYEYATARLKIAPPRNGKVWKNPPGFAQHVADIGFEAERESVRLLDAAGTLLTQFVFENHPEGCAIRFGKGKFTVSTHNPKAPRVRYWDPRREFKWTPKTWKFKTPMADRPFASSDRSTGLSSDSTSSSSSRAASAAPFAAAGGTFDGGGASQSWSDATASGARTEAAAASTSY